MSLILPPSDGSLHSTLNLLDSLEQFYNNQRLWIDQTRVALDRAFDESEVIHPQSSSFSSSSDSSSNNSVRSDTTSDDDEQCNDTPETGPHWVRRKKGLRLKLESFNTPPLYKHIRRITSRRDLNQRKRMLEMLDEIAQARIDSCRLVRRMVRHTNSGMGTIDHR